MNKKKLIIGLTGEKLAGKGTIAAYLAQEYNAKVYRMSGILDDILERLHLPIARENEIDLGAGLRDKFGEDVLAQCLKKDIEKDPHDLIVVDGIRMPREVEVFSSLPGFILVYVTASLEVRFARMKQRKEKLDEQDMDFAQFKEIEEKKITETSIPVIAQKAKVKIVNRGTIQELYAKVSNNLLAKYHQRSG